MARTFTHKIEGKFHNNLIEYDDVPQNIKNKWDRKNSDQGKFRKLRKEKQEKEFEKYNKP